MAQTATETWMKWYRNMDPNDRKAYNRKRYADRRDKQSTYAREYYQKNQNYQKCVQYTNTARNRPWALTTKSPKPKELEQWFLKYEGQPCKFCGDPSDSLDHIIPLSHNGKHEFDNFQLICWTCNYMKSDMSEKEFTTHLDKLRNYNSKVGV